MNTSLPPAALAETFSDPTRDRLVSLLGAGVSQTAAALACGVTDGYISQLLEDPQVIAAIGNLRAEKLETAIKVDKSVEALEARALETLAAKLPYAKSALETARIYQILNTAKRKATSSDLSSDAASDQLVTIVLPKAAKVHVALNTQNQVIEIQGRSMATLPSKSLPLLSDIRSKQKADDAAAAQEVLARLKSPELTTIINGVESLL